MILMEKETGKCISHTKLSISEFFKNRIISFPQSCDLMARDGVYGLHHTVNLALRLKNIYYLRYFINNSILNNYID